MNNLPVLSELSKDQVALIKATVAKNATDDELKLFLYRCSQMGLDPLKPGQIYFIKYSSAPGVMVVGIDGFRAKAEASGKHTGTKRGIIRDNKGVAIGAWCEVYRNDWTEPAREEVSLKEYNTGKSQWLKMPETMIKKVAEVAALRMAFPDLLGGLYSQEEMDQAEPVTKPIKEAVIINEPIQIKEKLNEPNQAPRNTQQLVAKNNPKQEVNRPVGNTSNVAKVKNHAPSADEIKASKPGAARETPKVTQQQQPVSEPEASPASEDSFPEDLTSATDTSLDENFIDNEMKDAIIQHGANHGWEPDDIGHLIYSKFRLLGWSKVQIKHYNEIWLAIEKKDG